MKFLHAAPLLLTSYSLISIVLAQGNPETFWSDYPACEESCHQSVWSDQSCSLTNSCSCSGCLCLALSCLCETSSWLIAVAQCIGSSCGSSAVYNAADIASDGCGLSGYPLIVASADLVSIGLAAVTDSGAATTNGGSAATATAEGGVGFSAAVTSQVVAAPTVTVFASTSSEAGASTPVAKTVTEAAGGRPGTTTIYPSSSNSPVASSSGQLSTGAKAGIGAGAAVIGIVLFVALGLFIRKQQQNGKTEKKNPDRVNVSAEPYRVSEPGGTDLGGGAAVGEQDEKKTMHVVAKPISELGGLVGPILQDGTVLYPVMYPDKEPVLSVEEKQELEGRRRAAELSGAGDYIPVEVGDGERDELEARRRVYEMA